MTFEDFYPFVLPYVPGCPEQTVTHHIRQAAIEFCQSALVWRESLDTLLADGFSTDYALALDDQVEVAKLLGVKLDDVLVPVLAWPAALGDAAPQAALLADRRTLTINPAPADGQRIDVRAALKPSMACFSFPDEVFAHNADHIAKGALARLLMMPKQDWTDVNVAAAYDAQFKGAAMSQARAAERGNARWTPKDTSQRFY